MGKIIKFKYDIGETIKYKMKVYHPIFEVCKFCGGTGQIQGMDETYEECPVCEGQKSNHVRDVLEEKIVEGPISAIHIHYDSNAYPTSDKPYYSVLRDPHDVKEEDIIERVYSEEEQLAYSD